MTDLDELHDVKGLAFHLKRNESYVYDMKSAGFHMPGGRASLRQAVQWLANHGFTRAEAAKVRFARRSSLKPNNRDEPTRASVGETQSK